MLFLDQRRSLFTAPLILPIASLLLVALVLGLQHIFPQLHCPIKASCGIKCPGCGGTSAIHSLLAGDFSSALKHNFLIIGGLLLVATWGVCAQIYQCKTGKQIPLPITLTTGILLTMIIIAFTIFRNL